MHMMGEVFDRCPIAAMRQPWVGAVWAAYRAYEKGCVLAVEPEPSAQLMDCIDETVRAVAQVERRANERRASGRKRKAGPDGKR